MKKIIKESYEKVFFLSKRIRGYIDLIRPFTLLAPIIVGACIMIACLAYTHRESILIHWKTIVYACITLAIVNGASNALNQATDVEADKISKPYRPIPQGVVTKTEAQSISYILYLFALFRAGTINLWFGFLIFLIVLFTVTYSLPPRMKRFLFLNQVWIAIPRGFLGILAAWSVFGDPLQNVPLIIGIISTLFFIGGMSTKDIVDKDADKKTGVKTLVNTYGIKKTAIISFPFMFFSFVFIPLLINSNLLESYLWPLTFTAVLGASITVLMFHQKESKLYENIPAWMMMYVTYFIFAVGFMVLVVINPRF